MKTFALAAALALLGGVAGPAAAVEVIAEISAPRTAPPPGLLTLTAGDLTIAPSTTIVAPPTGMSELPEPQVFLMMLLGLCLIGYRASRVSDEKFK